MNNETIKTSVIAVIAVAVITGAISVGGALKQTVVVQGPTNTVDRVIPINSPTVVGSTDGLTLDPSGLPFEYGTGTSVTTFGNSVRFGGSSGARLNGSYFASSTAFYGGTIVGTNSSPSGENVTSTKITVTGADVGDPCMIALDDDYLGDAGSWGTGYTTSTLAWHCLVSAADTATVVAINTATSAAATVDSAPIGVLVWDIYGN